MKKIIVLFFLALSYLDVLAGNIIINTREDLYRAIQLNEKNLIIESDIDLKGDSITLPQKSSLSFQGGIIRNGVVVGAWTAIMTCGQCFDNVVLAGKYEHPISLENIVDCHRFDVDCAKYINNLFEIQNVVNLPDYSIHTYIPIKMSSGKCLRGNTQLGSTVYVHNCNGIELEDNIRNIEIAYLSLTNYNRRNYYPTNNSTGILSNGEMTGAHIRIHDINFNGFKYGVHFTDVFWSSSVERCRFNHCDVGFWGDRKTIGSSIVNTFKDDIFNECLTYGLLLDGYNELMISCCNFGGVDRKIEDETQRAMCRLNFCKCVEVRSCNFEKMTLGNFSAALYFNTCDAIVSSCTFADLKSSESPNKVSDISFSSAVLANYKSNIELFNIRWRDNKLFMDVLSYENASIIIHTIKEYDIKTQSYSGGVIKSLE